MHNISHAELHWGDDGFPRSSEYGDVYFSVEDGLAETRHNFLNGNSLTERWSSEKSSNFTICETGFGSGLSFLASWQLWDATAPADAILHYISVEKHPLTSDDLAKVHVLFPELEGYSAELQAYYPEASYGFHRITLAQGRVKLTLLYGDAYDMLRQLNCTVDAWFLGGFNPSKNQDMWDDKIFAQMQRLSHADTTLASFTAARDVKCGLEKSGFTVQRPKGFGKKRNMITGRCTKPYTPLITPTRRNEPDHAIIVGGGIAGCSAAYALATRGWKVTLIERHPALANEASGNPAGILFPQLTRAWTRGSLFYLNGYGYTQQLIKQLTAVNRPLSHDFCGMVQYPSNDDEHARLQSLPELLNLPASIAHWVDEKSSNGPNLLRAEGGLYFPSSGWVCVPEFCRALTNHPNISTMLASEALTFSRDEKTQKWQVNFTEGSEQTSCLSSTTLVIANANDAKSFPSIKTLPTYTIHGQINYMGEQSYSKKIDHVACFGGYITPQIDGFNYLGATYDSKRTELNICEAAHAENIRKFAAAFPHITPPADTSPIQGRAGLRCVSTDRMPIIGQACIAGSETAIDGLYLSIAHASRGLLSAPIAGELIASLIHGEALPISPILQRDIIPSRFTRRTERKQQSHPPRPKQQAEW